MVVARKAVSAIKTVKGIIHSYVDPNGYARSVGVRMGNNVALWTGFTHVRVRAMDDHAGQQCPHHRRGHVHHARWGHPDSAEGDS